MIWNVYCVSDTEYEKADRDVNYIPAEYFAGTVSAETLKSADRKAKVKFGSSAMVKER